MEEFHIVVWANRDWCYYDELEEYGASKSDDYYICEGESEDGEPTEQQLEDYSNGRLSADND